VRRSDKARQIRGISRDTYTWLVYISNASTSKGQSALGGKIMKDNPTMGRNKVFTDRCLCRALAQLSSDSGLGD
jgi:hypothetical protein